MFNKMRKITVILFEIYYFTDKEDILTFPFYTANDIVIKHF